MIEFTEYIGFFRVFDLLVGGKNDQNYWIYWIIYDFSIFRPLAAKSKWLILLNILEFLDFLASCWELNWAILLDISNSFDFSTFRPPAGRSKWLILLTIFDFLLFSTFRHLSGRSKWFILLTIFFFTFRLFGLLVGGINNHFYWIYSIFSTYRPLARRSNWSTLLDTLDYFDFSTFWPD